MDVGRCNVQDIALWRQEHSVQQLKAAVNIKALLSHMLAAR